MDPEIFIPIVFFITLAAAVIGFIIYRHRSFLATQQTLQKIIDTDQPLTPEVIQAVGVKAAPTPYTDLRRAVLFIAFGIATAIFGQFVPEEEAHQVFLGLAAFPFLLGLGFLAVHYMAKNQK